MTKCLDYSATLRRAIENWDDDDDDSQDSQGNDDDYDEDNNYISSPSTSASTGNTGKKEKKGKMEKKQKKQKKQKDCLNITSINSRAQGDALSDKDVANFLADGISLKPYQLVGLNWIKLLHSTGLNGVRYT